MTAEAQPTTYTSTHTTVCRLDDIEVEGGVLALVSGEAVAVFRTHAGDVFALSGYDPLARACVLARGIVGTRGDIDVVASPMHKQSYDLRTGQCLDDESVRITTYDVRVTDDGQVLVGGPLDQHLDQHLDQAAHSKAEAP